MTSLVGKISLPVTLKGEVAIGKDVIYPELQNKTVIPSGKDQEVRADDGIYGLDTVTVKAVNLQDKTVEAEIDDKIVQADGEFTGLNSVTVKGIKINNITIQYTDQETTDQILKYIETVYTPNTFSYNKLTELRLTRDLIVEDDTKTTITLNNMFYNCTNLTRIVSNEYKIKTKNKTVYSMYSLFSHCKNLIEIDMNIFDFEYDKNNDQRSIFYNCNKLESIKNLKINSQNYDTNMFRGCTELRKLTFDGTALSPSQSKDMTLTLVYSPLLNDESMRNMINSLGANETGYLRKITITEQVMTSLSEETKQLFIDKNYTLEAADAYAINDLVEHYDDQEGDLYAE